LIHAFTRNHGYALTSQRTIFDKDKNLIKIYLQCDRGGSFKPTVNEDERVRQKLTRHTECPFSSYLRFYKGFGGWKLVLRDTAHNHGPTLTSSLPTLRAREMLANEDYVKTQLQIGLSTRQIIRGLRHQHEECSLTAQDIYNYRKRLRQQLLEARTPIQALLHQFPDDGDWVVNFETTEENRLYTLFCTHKSSLENLRRYHHVLFMDCTYKTNKL
jgi:hypothetical protein